ncbi:MULTISPECIES: restriction endonuclease subunit S [unclassified Staphylococcus]|uniref:restriction endonuclease subunit S n=1 Tax=unclassified Staphylococcus TaxID=91994 RepID=UPI00194DF711|nr:MULTISPECIES: restriction endonuclease subunit S [unclassified Staphylococcus]
MEYKVSEILNIISGGTPRRNNNEYWNGDIPWLTVKDFNNDNRLVHDTQEKITMKGLENSSATLVSKGTVIISARGTVGELCQAAKSMTFNQSCFGLEAKTKYTTNEYIYYWFKYKINYVKNNTHGSVFDTINRKTFENLYINLPNIRYQNKVVNILRYLDNKIENNKQIIKNLEELSQTLFKRWFVDFEFPDENGNPYKSSGGEMIDSELGNIPRDWEVNELGNYVDIIKGLSYKGAFLDKQHERSDSFPLLSISNFNFISGFKSNKTKYYFGDYKERHLVNPGDILIAATDLTQDRKILGAPAIIPNLNKTMIFSLDVFKITETTIPKYVLYFLLQSAKYREFVEGSATGTTVIRIAKNVILKVPIVIDKDISLKFDNLIKPYMEKIEHLSQENQKLTQLRDTLLPKLMSGEIEMPDDIEVNEDELSI